ncbi:MAG TPA: hypothetical protein VMT46_05700 [Anaerolineaceae bacterium]|nr:hypothetical protein [Anaerolineaceae bacterium]
MNPAIVVSAFNRPLALERLLESLQAAEYPPGASIPLVISLDESARHQRVAQVARSFIWPFGPKEIRAREERLGPVEHFYACGDLTGEFGSIVFLEDDLLVSPQYYAYASQALEAYAGDECVGGLSLYGLWFNSYTRQPFIPLPDAGDVFFIQAPYIQGLAFTGEQWAAFHAWRESKATQQAVHAPFHECWGRFSGDEWFPWLARFLVASGQYFAFPRESLVTGFGDKGTHFARSTPFFQVPIQREPRAYSFPARRDCTAVYDSFFELLPDRIDRLTTSFHWLDYTVDLYATRALENIPTPYVLTTRPCPSPIMAFGRTMRPMELNLEYGVPGREIFFCRKEDLRWDPLAEWEIFAGHSRYFGHGRGVSLRDWARVKMGEMARRIFDFRR